MGTVLYTAAVLVGPYAALVGASFAFAAYLQRGSEAQFINVEWHVLWLPLLACYLLMVAIPHWSGKTMSNLLADPLALGATLGLLTVGRGIAGRRYPHMRHARWYLLAVAVVTVLVWLVMPALPE